MIFDIAFECLDVCFGYIELLFKLTVIPSADVPLHSEYDNERGICFDFVSKHCIYMYSIF